MRDEGHASQVSKTLINMLHFNSRDTACSPPFNERGSEREIEKEREREREREIERWRKKDIVKERDGERER